METEKELVRQTEKMLGDIKKKRKKLKLVDKSKESIVKNLDAYISDTQHFIDKKDIIRAYEAVVYAWGILETMEHAGIIELYD
jgi:hypothetical protein